MTTGYMPEPKPEQRKLDVSVLPLQFQMVFKVYADYLRMSPEIAMDQALLNFQDVLVGNALIAHLRGEIQEMERQIALLHTRQRQMMHSQATRNLDCGGDSHGA
ncbi:hypothetical protein AB3R30_18770 [Leptolyngbyaceae cyanobacterium UHCC 1019]